MVVERGPAAPVRVGGGLEGHESARPAATFRKAEAGHLLQVRDGVRDGRAVPLAEVALDDVGNGASAPHVAGLFSGSKKFFLYLLVFHTGTKTGFVQCNTGARDPSPTQKKFMYEFRESLPNDSNQELGRDGSHPEGNLEWEMRE